jgi:hypothetical protein
VCPLYKEGKRSNSARCTKIFSQGKFAFDFSQGFKRGLASCRCKQQCRRETWLLRVAPLEDELPIPSKGFELVS